MDSLPPQPMLLILVIVLILCIVNTLARTASVAVSDAWLKQQAEDGNKKAKRLCKILEKNSSGFMDSLEFCSLILLIVFSGFSIILIGELLESRIVTPSAEIWAVLISAVVIWVIYSIVAVMLPRRIAAKYSEKMSLVFVGYTAFVTVVSKPFLFIVSGLSKLLARIFGVKGDDINEEVTEEEIRMMVDIGLESGAIDDDEKQMIHNIFEMDDKPVEEIMTHRTEADILWIEDSLDKWKEVMDETNHTRYPICGESIDDVLGIVNSRDFYRFLLSGGKDVHTIMRDVFFIPDTIKADELFSKMQLENEHMGIVMDEYGGFQGIVTQEDLLEEIVGELYSEYDEPEIIEEKDIVKLEENVWKINGSAEIEDVEEELGISTGDGDFNTFAGFVLSELQAIPADGETVELETNNLKIKVTSVVDHKINEAIVTVVPQEDEEDDEE